MDNIVATKIENGVVVNSAKKVKISKWDELVKNAQKVDTKVDSNSIDVKPSLSTKPEWEVVNTSFENVDVERNAKPIRVAEDSFNNIEQKGNKVREDNYTEVPEVDYSVPTFDYEENKTLEDYGYSEDFSKAVEDVVNNSNLEEFNEPEFEIPKFEEYEQENTTKPEMVNAEKEDNNLEEIIRKALDESLKPELEKREEPSFEEKEESKVEEEKQEVGISANNLQINDLMQELAQLSEANDSLKGSIASLENRNVKMKKSIDGIEKETKNYDEMSLKNAKELLLKAREEQQMLRDQEENVINAGKDLKARLISADEANLSAKKRSDYLSEMLLEHDYQPAEKDAVKTYSA